MAGSGRFTARNGGNTVAAKRVDFTYDAASQFSTIKRYSSLAGGTGNLVATSTYTFDDAGRLTGLSHTNGSNSTIAGYSWTFDTANRVTQFHNSANSSENVNYSYDADGQLLSGAANETYSYDANGNRTATHSNNYGTGGNNRLFTDGTYSYEYDGEGNRTKRIDITSGASAGSWTEYAWDHRNRLTSVTEKDSSGAIQKQFVYTYDVFDRRIAKSVDNDGPGSGAPVLTYYAYDGQDIVLTFDGNSSVTHRYLHGPVIDMILADEESSGNVYYALADNEGTVRDVVDSSGSVVDHIAVDSYGKITSETGSHPGYLFIYTGRERDPETGLYYYRARYYDASAGRFIGEDPLGFGAGDTNLSRYVGNSPTNATDPSGLEKKKKPPRLDPEDQLESIEKQQELLNKGNRRPSIKDHRDWEGAKKKPEQNAIRSIGRSKQDEKNKRNRRGIIALPRNGPSGKIIGGIQCVGPMVGPMLIDAGTGMLDDATDGAYSNVLWNTVGRDPLDMWHNIQNLWYNTNGARQNLSKQKCATGGWEK